jgi:hypothetical protein
MVINSPQRLKHESKPGTLLPGTFSTSQYTQNVPPSVFKNVRRQFSVVRDLSNKSTGMRAVDLATTGPVSDETVQRKLQTHPLVREGAPFQNKVIFKPGEENVKSGRGP